MPTDADADPTAPLDGPPDPWDEAPTPSVRPGPPWHMTDMIAAEPSVARRIIARVSAPTGGAAELADAIRATLEAGGPVVVTGCGTSEHGALAVADIVREAAREGGLTTGDVSAVQAFELSLAPPTRGLVIGISHEGGTRATIDALRASRDAGVRTAAITTSRRSPIGTLAGLTIETAELDQGWCHTVGYLSPMVVGSVVGSMLSGRPLDGEAVVRLLVDGAADPDATDSIAGHLADASRLLVIASGVDRTAARELVLKVEEAAWLPAAFRDVETFLHGHLPATDPGTGLVLIMTERDRRQERIARARQALAAARVVGLRSAAIVSADVSDALDPALTPAGRIVVGEAPSLPAAVASLMSTASALQLMTERIARARGTNPDLIRRDDPVYLAASEAASS